MTYPLLAARAHHVFRQAMPAPAGGMLPSVLASLEIKYACVNDFSRLTEFIYLNFRISELEFDFYIFLYK
jgi:hypothetical protein